MSIDSGGHTYSALVCIVCIVDAVDSATGWRLTRQVQQSLDVIEYHRKRRRAQTERLAEKLAGTILQ